MVRHHSKGIDERTVVEDAGMRFEKRCEVDNTPEANEAFGKDQLGVVGFRATPVQDHASLGRIAGL
jgi:hypothetical protein